MVGSVFLRGPEVPKLVDKEQKKRQIALTAVEVFAEHGFEATSISQIAEAAGIGKGTVYEYFESKEDLITHAMTAWVEQMSQAAAGELEGIEDPPRRLRRFAELSMQAFLSDERVARVAIAMFQALLSGGVPAHHDLIREMFQGFRKTITDILLDGVARGVFRPEVARDAERIAINLTAYLDGIGLHYYMSRSYFDLEEQVGYQVEQLLASLAPHEPRRPGEE